MKRELDTAIKASLRSFWKDTQGWYGREREMISLFCFRHLLTHFQRGNCLHDCGQIGIEVAVRQLPKEVLHRGKCKQDVCKDVVIWPKPKMNAWDSEGKRCNVEPLAVMEWKAINKSDSNRARRMKIAEHKSDKDWLKQKSNAVKRVQGNFVGYAVFIDRTRTASTFTCARVSDGRIKKDWVRYRRKVKGHGFQPCL